MGALRYIRMVLWSFFGIRRRSAAIEEQAKVKPLGLAAVAVALVALFCLTLWGLAKLAIGSLGMTPAREAPAGATSGAQAKPTASVENTMAQRMQACVVCHGKEGRATNAGYFPRIAGKPQGYLYNQLKSFQAGQRSNQAMNHLIQHMSDDYLHEIAKYFAELDLPYPPAHPHGLTPAQQRVAETLITKGMPERQIPACISCHGENMAGRLPAMPGLLTLPADYLIGQLGAWRTGQRKASAPDCMAEVANRLFPEEIGAVARWLSSQTLPTGIKPAAASTQPLPIRCGSGEQ